jgi:peptidoglycan/LPS O-acetylase OafA/YrhL
MAEFTVKNDSIKSIQILRAIAAFMVAYLHSTGRGGVNLLPHIGAFGVDIFFIISGFVIAFIVTKDAKYFLIKRIIRIVPLYIIATLIMVLACILFPEKINKVVATVPAFIKSILFIPYKIKTKFEPTGPLLEQGWTLNSEMFFYVIMSLCILLVRNKKYIVMTCTGILVIMIIVLNSINSDIFIVGYYRNGLFPEFVYGILLFYVYDYFKHKHKGYLLVKNPVINMMVFGTIAIISFGCLAGTVLSKYNINNRNVYWGIPALFLVFSFLNMDKQIKENAFVGFWLKLGDASYALYIFHTFIAMFFTRIVFVNMIAGNTSFAVSLILEIIIMASTIFGSIVIYTILDKPIQNYLRGVLKKYDANKRGKK